MTRAEAELILATLRLRGGPPAAELADGWRRLGVSADLVPLLRLEGAELWLYRRLRTLGISVDPALGDALRTAAHRDALIGLRVDEETEAVSAVLERAGIPFALIKGPARRAATAIYPFADARSTSDVDLLVPATRGSEAWAALVSAGYEMVENAGTPEDHFHFPPLWSARRVAIELHASTSAWVDPAEAWRRATDDGADRVEWAGRIYTIASATELLWHGLTHAFMHGGDGVRLRTFLDGAAILASGRPIDWDLIEQRIVSGEARDAEARVARPRELRRWIATAAVLGGVDVPAATAASGSYPLARLLRWRAMTLGAGVGQAGRGRLLEEAARCEFGMGLTPAVARTSRIRWARRLAASATARAIYVGWRTVMP